MLSFRIPCLTPTHACDHVFTHTYMQIHTHLCTYTQMHEQTWIQRETHISFIRSFTSLRAVWFMNAIYAELNGMFNQTEPLRPCKDCLTRGLIKATKNPSNLKVLLIFLPLLWIHVIAPSELGTFLSCPFSRNVCLSPIAFYPLIFIQTSTEDCLTWFRWARWSEIVFHILPLIVQFV